MLYKTLIASAMLVIPLSAQSANNYQDILDKVGVGRINYTIDNFEESTESNLFHIQGVMSNNLVWAIERTSIDTEEDIESSLTKLGLGYAFPTTSGAIIVYGNMLSNEVCYYECSKNNGIQLGAKWVASVGSLVHTRFGISSSKYSEEVDSTTAFEAGLLFGVTTGLGLELKLSRTETATSTGFVLNYHY